MPGRLGFPPVVWGCPAPLPLPRTGAWFSVPLDQRVCHARPPNDKCVESHPFLPPMEFFRTQPLSHPLLLPQERPAGKEFQQMFLLRLEHKLLWTGPTTVAMLPETTCHAGLCASMCVHTHCVTVKAGAEVGGALRTRMSEGWSQSV